LTTCLQKQVISKNLDVVNYNLKCSAWPLPVLDISIVCKVLLTELFPRGYNCGLDYCKALLHLFVSYIESRENSYDIPLSLSDEQVACETLISNKSGDLLIAKHNCQKQLCATNIRYHRRMCLHPLANKFNSKIADLCYISINVMVNKIFNEVY